MYSPETWVQASEINFGQAAFPLIREKTTRRMREGNLIFAYISKLQKIAGILEIAGSASVNPDISEFGAPGQYPIVIKTRPIHIVPPGEWLDVASLVGKLRLFRGLSNKKNWTMAVRLTPRDLASCDTGLLMDLIAKLPNNNG
jgi:hypothetical protein